jgi:hypothetical protein
MVKGRKPKTDRFNRLGLSGEVEEVFHQWGPPAVIISTASNVVPIVQERVRDRETDRGVREAKSNSTDPQN